MKVTILNQGDRFTRDVVCDGPAAEDLASLLDAEREIDGHAFGAWVARWMHGMLICDRPATMLEMALYLEWADVQAEVVYEGDEFDYALGLEPKLVHKPNDQQRGELQYAYAVARFRDGEKKFTVLNKLEIESIKASSASKNKAGEIVGPWVDWPAEMWKKTAIRRLCKTLPLSVEVKGAIEADGETELPQFELLDLGDETIEGEAQQPLINE